MFSQFMNSMIFSFLLFVGFTCAAPLVARDVWDPPVTSPTSGTVWNVGETQTITWDTSSKPAQVTSYTGKAVLGYLDPSSPGEHLFLDSPLASGFNLTDGKVQITVPDVPARSTYIVVLMGDSGNASPQFTINGGSASSSSASASASSIASSAVSTVSPSPTTLSPTSSAPSLTLTTTTASSVETTTIPASSVVSFTLGSTSSTHSESSSSAPATQSPGSNATTNAALRTSNARTLFASALGVMTVSLLVLA
ncbi:hypothetical protein GLOTRDRAFT_112513 [Gloeophyllum trabeum ATCC 11539]|uniref:Ser-Thr-rich glycosyl-phosphatidyl-inositol-anchored membrane family-domain-containing protein n=1 Tax=Gloeophyllum trabeum (strain ATCC 11539 / FP-39264 / Madison 617) TaxID=670483 RepID=S7REV8_GLOTA|nr:uncharacterized protein GLOTRDRAFT_112513 [Gloeophyllum trabeum ATCC 11539]EPQ50989.1 hypothetical protein GLOTRDRAFT_112513 [Gloeophyllum trabeum ATCC 11539]